MRNYNFDETKRLIREHFKVSAPAMMAHKILDALPHTRSTDGNTFYLSAIAEAVRAENIDQTLLSALGVLSQSTFAIFTPVGVFVDENDEHHTLSPKEFGRALSENIISHPVTGEDVPEATSRITPAFILR